MIGTEFRFEIITLVLLLIALIGPIGDPRIKGPH